MMNRKCVTCGGDLTDFVGYIPTQGESCLHCFIEFMLAEDRMALSLSAVSVRRSMNTTVDHTRSIPAPIIPA